MAASASHVCGFSRFQSKIPAWDSAARPGIRGQRNDHDGSLQATARLATLGSIRILPSHAGVRMAAVPSIQDHPAPASATSVDTISTDDDRRTAAPPGASTYIDRAIHLWTRTRLSDSLLAWVDRRRRWLLGCLVLIYALGFSTTWRLEADSTFVSVVGPESGGRQRLCASRQEPSACLSGHANAFCRRLQGAQSTIPDAAPDPDVADRACHSWRLLQALPSRGRPAGSSVPDNRPWDDAQFYRYSFELLSDMPFLFGVAMFLCGYEAIFHPKKRTVPSEADQTDLSKQTSSLDHRRAELPASRPRWFDWLSLIGGLVITVSTRPAMWAMVFAAVGAMGWSILRGRLGWRQITVATVVVAAVVVFYLRDPRHSAHERPARQHGVSAGRGDVPV